MRFQRASGVLLHPTSLPGPHGIGDFGPEAFHFIDFLAGSSQTLWQMLPLNPVGPSNSPYQCYSAFAGNPLLISAHFLVEKNLLSPGARQPTLQFPRDKVHFATAERHKLNLLRRGYERFRPGTDYEEFCDRHATWLDDYALFMALREAHRGLPWNKWEPQLAGFQPAALNKARRKLWREIGFYRFSQYLFFREQAALKHAANARGVRLLGDLPIFVAHNSSDLWANQHLFYLDQLRNPAVVAGVPPDFFSVTGQRWGNPLYRWDAMERDGFRWWLQRLSLSLELFDIVRVDHFRGFEAYWEIPYGEPTAANGRWVRAPGLKFLRAVSKQFREIPIIAEDLGVITPRVEALRDRFGLTGMKVLQFAFSGPDSEYLPQNFAHSNYIVYTGTHDNDTTRGWWASAPKKERAFARRYLATNGIEIHWDLIRSAFESIAALAVVPLQDLLGLGSEARMNTPGTADGNWTWRYRSSALTTHLRDRLKDLTHIHNRDQNGPGWTRSDKPV